MTCQTASKEGQENIYEGASDKGVTNVLSRQGLKVTLKQKYGKIYNKNKPSPE